MDIKKVDNIVDEHNRLFRDCRDLQSIRAFTNKSSTEPVSLAMYIEHPQKGTLAQARYLEINKELLREFIDKWLAKKHKRMEEIEQLFAKVKE